jgi:peptide/nickel transport system permease protein
MLAFMAFLLRRVIQSVPLILVVIVINFILIHLAPGDPVDMLTGQMDTTEQYRAELRAEFGLDRPLVVQLGKYVANIATLDLGYSVRYRQPVLDLILSRFPATMLLMGASLLISSSLGILLGSLAGRFPYSGVDNVTSVVALIGYSMPIFWLGQLTILLFALNLGWLPTQGMYSLRTPSAGLGRTLVVLQHLILPALVLSVYHLTLIFRLMRNKMQEVLAQDFILMARAKGVSESGVLFRHGLRNAVLPIITVIGMDFGYMLSGSVLTETVFAWPGMGRLLYEAITARDYPVLMGLFTCLSLIVVIANLVTDLIYAVVDPRVVRMQVQQ